MRRAILVILLILSLFQGFWQEERELVLGRANHDEPGISEPASNGETLCNPRQDQCFARIFAGSRQTPHLPQSQRQTIARQPSVAWLFNAPGQNRRIDDAIHPIEWGLIVLRLPRSDG